MPLVGFGGISGALFVTGSEDVMMGVDWASGGRGGGGALSVGLGTFGTKPDFERERSLAGAVGDENPGSLD